MYFAYLQIIFRCYLSSSDRFVRKNAFIEGNLVVVKHGDASFVALISWIDSCWYVIDRHRSCQRLLHLLLCHSYQHIQAPPPLGLYQFSNRCVHLSAAGLAVAQKQHDRWYENYFNCLRWPSRVFQSSCSLIVVSLGEMYVRHAPRCLRRSKLGNY